MTERPILFSAPMVRALLAGTKTQTRRTVKPQPRHVSNGVPFGAADPRGFGAGGVPIVCPYGVPGDRLWVKETWRTTGDDGRCDDVPPRGLQPHPVWYEADGAAPAEQLTGKVRVSIFMPRWASRITLELTDVRVERLQDVSEADAIAEGSFTFAAEQDTPLRDVEEARIVYREIWQSINGLGSWDANPWVWCVSFRRVTP